MTRLGRRRHGEWNYRGHWKKADGKGYDYKGDFRIEAMGNLPIKISASIVIEPNHIRVLSKKEREWSGLEGPLKKEDIDTFLKIIYEGMDMSSVFEASFREGNFIYGTGGIGNTGQKEFLAHHSTDIIDIRTLDELESIVKVGPACHKKLRDLVFNDSKLPQNYKESIREFLEIQ